MPNEAQVSRWGNSLAVRIPQSVVKDARLAEGDRLALDISPDGSIVLRPTTRKYSLEELLSGIKPGNLHGETDWGLPQGKESL